MASNSKQNRVSQQAADQSLIDGFQLIAATIPSFTIAGVLVQTTTIISALQARIAARAAVTPPKATWQAAVKAATAEVAESADLVSGARQALQVMFAGQIEKLATFGLKPRKAPAPRTPEQKAASAAKAKATREARHTMGSKQKAAVTGETAAKAAAAPDAATATATVPATAAAPVTK